MDAALGMDDGRIILQQNIDQPNHQPITSASRDGMGSRLAAQENPCSLEGK
jgi:hypothetical protein